MSGNWKWILDLWVWGSVDDGIAVVDIVECTERYIYLRPWEWCFKSCRYKLSRSDPGSSLISRLLLLYFTSCAVPWYARAVHGSCSCCYTFVFVAAPQTLLHFTLDATVASGTQTDLSLPKTKRRNTWAPTTTTWGMSMSVTRSRLMDTGADFLISHLVRVSFSIDDIL